jgi:hypothetical protein
VFGFPKVRGVRVMIALLTVFAVGGCQRGPSPTGSSGFVFVDSPRAPAGPTKAVAGEAKYPKISEDFQEAVEIGPLASPIYPRNALAAKTGRVTVGVRITVDASGRVSDVGTSMVTLSTPGPFADDFFTAVNTAVRQWRFRPAEVQRIERVEAPGLEPFSRILSREKVETHFDLAFTFTAADGVESK